MPKVNVFSSPEALASRMPVWLEHDETTNTTLSNTRLSGIFPITATREQSPIQPRTSTPLYAPMVHLNQESAVRTNGLRPQRFEHGLCDISHLSLRDGSRDQIAFQGEPVAQV